MGRTRRPVGDPVRAYLGLRAPPAALAARPAAEKGDLSLLTDDELDQLEALLARLEARAALVRAYASPGRR